MDNNLFVKIYSRMYQKVLYAFTKGSKDMLPELINENNGLIKVCHIIKEKGFTKPMIFTDSYLDSVKIYSPLTDELDKNNIPYVVFNEVVANPTTDVIEKSKDVYIKNGCDMMIAIGGGSSMDTAKACGALITRPDKTLKKMRGILKVGKKIPFLVCVPTTAGTGSEVTVAAVVTDKKNNDKFAINDFNLVPDVAVLDASLLVNLPKSLTATTGMDALTHAVESYIGKSNTKSTMDYAERAVKLIFENLENTYNNGKDINSRQNMLQASFYAGLAFTKAYVGTVHALAHSFGGYFNLPHGLANAVILPIVLEYYKDSVIKPLSNFARIIGIEGENDTELKDKFILKVKELNKKLNIPDKFDLTLNDDDINKLVDHAFKEICPLYPVPTILSKKELSEICKKVTK